MGRELRRSAAVSVVAVVVVVALALLVAPPAEARKRKNNAKPPRARVQVVHVNLGPALWPVVETRVPRVLLLPLAGAGQSATELEALSRAVAQGVAARPRVHLEGGVGAPLLLLAELGEGAQVCARDLACSAELAGAFGARYALAGTVDLVEGAAVATFVLIDADSGEEVVRLTRLLERRSEPLDVEVQSTSLLALRPLLQEGRAHLSVGVSEPSATVRLDGEILGEAPIEGREVAGGPHLVEVSREGFHPHGQTLELGAGQRVELKVALEPTAAYLEGHRARASASRILALSSLGVGAALAAGGGGALLWSALRADELNRSIRETNEVGGFTPEQKAALDGDTLIAHVGTGTGVTLVIVGGALVTTGAALLWLGGDPDRYRDAAGHE